MNLKKQSGVTFQNELQGPQTCPEAQINSCYGCKSLAWAKDHKDRDSDFWKAVIIN
jgi:hypothetical protein